MGLARERVLSILLLLTLLTGIIMALCISILVRSPDKNNKFTDRGRRFKYIRMEMQTITDVDKMCSCNVKGLSYKYTQYMAGINDKPYVPYGPYAPYVPMKGDFNKNATPTSVDHNAPIQRPPTKKPTKSNRFLTDEMIDEIWRAIAKKKLNISNENPRKRRFPKEVTRCFVPNLELPQMTLDYKRKNWKFQQYLVSISGQRYLDDADDRYYLCSGTIVDKKHAITGVKCVRDIPGDLLKIRSDSPYWSIGGTLHDIVGESRTSELAVLKVFPNFNVENQALKINVFPYVGREATSAGWSAKNGRKFSEYSLDHWGENCGNCGLAKLVETATYCDVFLGDPLISEMGSLVGVRACDSVFIKIPEIGRLLRTVKKYFASSRIIK